jgi:translation elongation factor EF-1alpha
MHQGAYATVLESTRIGSSVQHEQLLCFTTLNDLAIAVNAYTSIYHISASPIILITEADVQKGFVVCDELNPCRASTTLLCQVALVELTEQRPIFSSGYECVFHCHTCEEVSVSFICTLLLFYVSGVRLPVELLTMW